MDIISGREVVLGNLNHTDPPRPGFNFDNGRANDMRLVWLESAKSYKPRRWIEGDKEYYDDEWGNIWVRMVNGCLRGEIHQPAITDWSQLEHLQLPDYQSPDRFQGLARDLAQPTDQFNVAYIGGWIFDTARYLRKMEVYFLDMAMYPDELNRLHALVGKWYEARIHASGKAGADAIFIGEDLGTQKGLLFSPEMFRYFFKDQYTRLMAIAHEYGMKILMHSCGHNWDILDDLIDAGVDCFQFDQPAIYNMPALAEKLRQRKVGLWSPLDIQKFLPTGDRQIIEVQTDRMLHYFRGGLIAKNYPDLPGIGVKPEWDQWAYQRFLKGWN